MERWPNHPLIYEIPTRVGLCELSPKYHWPVTVIRRFLCHLQAGAGEAGAGCAGATGVRIPSPLWRTASAVADMRRQSQLLLFWIRGRMQRRTVCVSAIAAAILVCGVSFSQEAKVDPHIRASYLQQTSEPLVTGDTVSADNVLMYLFLHEPCRLSFIRTGEAHFALENKPYHLAGCWYPTTGGQFAVVLSNGATRTGVLADLPRALLGPGGEVTIVELNYNSNTFHNAEAKSNRAAPPPRERLVRIFFLDDTTNQFPPLPGAHGYTNGDTVPASAINTILFLEEPCQLSIVGAEVMHRAWLALGSHQLGCWYPTMNDAVVTIDGFGNIHPNEVYWQAYPRAVLHADGTATITEPRFQNMTQFMSDVVNAKMAESSTRHQHEKP
jgi:hypothetical protein